LADARAWTTCCKPPPRAAFAQLGTPFVATEECDAHARFKQRLAGAGPADVVEFMSVAGLPARAVLTPWLRRYLNALPRMQAKRRVREACSRAFDCLAQCGLRDGLAGFGQLCIDNQPAAALRGDVERGPFFRGAGALPFGARIVRMRELVERLLTPGVAPGTPPVKDGLTAAPAA
jgi:nitronate monooxygenase